MMIECIIMVATCTTPSTLINASIKGKLTTQTEKYYYVDFSESEDMKFYCNKIDGIRMIKKNRCVILNG